MPLTRTKIPANVVGSVLKSSPWTFCIHTSNILVGTLIKPQNVNFFDKSP